ncbi:MAG: hypothetical protein M3Z66_05485 [Chloroflexota bacterium]|nr:hypothetical protein [Chloroflexota bacterium]
MRLLILALTLALAAQVGPGTRALAHGPLLRGIPLQELGGYHGITGECACERQWYTIGFNPGPVKMNVVMGRAGTKLAATYGLRATLLHGLRQLQSATLACQAGARRCQPEAHFDFAVKKHGVYYLLIEGLGAHGVPYAIQLRAGALYRLRCRKYC